MGDTDNEEHKIWVGGLDWGCKERDLENTVYDTLGSNVRVVSVKILYDRETGRSKGFGFIGFEDPQIVKEAIAKMDGVEILGRKCKVNDVKKTSQTVPRTTYHGRERDDDRGRSSDQPERKATPQRGFRVSVTGLPDGYKWDQLKDLLRGGSSGTKSITYANVSRPGFGVGDFTTPADRDAAIDDLDNTTVDGCRIRVRILDPPSKTHDGDDSHRETRDRAPRSYDKSYDRSSDRREYEKAPSREGGRDGYERAGGEGYDKGAYYDDGGYEARGHDDRGGYEKGGRYVSGRGGRVYYEDEPIAYVEKPRGGRYVYEDEVVERRVHPGRSRGSAYEDQDYEAGGGRGGRYVARYVDADRYADRYETGGRGEHYAVSERGGGRGERQYITDDGYIVTRPAVRVVRDRSVIADDRYEEPVGRERSLRVVDDRYDEPVRGGYAAAAAGGSRAASARYVEECEDDYDEPAAGLAPVRYASARGAVAAVEYEEGGGYGPERRGAPVSGVYARERPVAASAAYAKEEAPAAAPRVARTTRTPTERSSGYEGGRYEPY